MERDSTYPVEFDQVLDKGVSRRDVIKYGTAAGAAGFLGGVSNLAMAVSQATTLMTFNNIAISTDDTVSLPEGYTYDRLVSWGDPILKGASSFATTNSSSDQIGQFGDNTDGMSLFHLKNADGSLDENRAVMAVNSEYINKKFMHTHKGESMTDDDVLKEIVAHGVNVFEVNKNSQGQWAVNQNSKYNRRLHGNANEFVMTGPVTGHDLLKTAADKTGRKIVGTFNNCGNGETPWGTYLTCEENFNGYFGAPEGTAFTKEQKAYGLSETGFNYNWWPSQERFDLSKNPNEAHRFGWIVEIDPMDPSSKAMKRSALGRFKHENAAMTINADGHAVVYMGDDERGEFIYKFVSRDKFKEGDRKHNMTLLENGTLYAAKFHDNGAGEWIELTHGKNGLTKANGFEDQAYVLVYARIAARFVGATTMDRPEWVACHPSSPMVFCTLTNNKYRGVKDDQPINAANPTEKNPYGHIIRWVPENRDHTSNRFGWDLFAVAGNPALHSGQKGGSDNVTTENMFNAPDGLAFDKSGRMWIQTDGNYKNEGDFAGHGNNQMLCADPVTGHIRRFMVGPRKCEITGISFSNDQRYMFVGIQHPGDSFPSADKDGVPRSTVIVVRREDGGIVGA